MFRPRLRVSCILHSTLLACTGDSDAEATGTHVGSETDGDTTSGATSAVTGNTEAPTTEGPPVACGDGEVDPGEQCDDGPYGPDEPGVAACLQHAGPHAIPSQEPATRPPRESPGMIMEVRVFLLSMMFAALPACGDPAGDGDSTSGDGTDITVENGCYDPAYVGVEAAEIGCGLLQSFGDPDFNMRFFEEVAIQSEFWGISPTVYPFDECPGNRNALSSPKGFILFGINLTVGTILDTGSELPLAGALAHEWAHQVQFAFGWSDDGEPTVRSTELEADAFSGYYMGLAKSWSGEEIDTYFQTLFNLGDYQFNHPEHHGTPQERVAAGALGLMVAQQAITNGTPYSHEELHQLFREAIAQTIVEPATPLAVSAAEPELIAAVSAIAAGRRSIRTIPARPVDPTLRARLFPVRAADAPRVRR